MGAWGWIKKAAGKVKNFFQGAARKVGDAIQKIKPIATQVINTVAPMIGGKIGSGMRTIGGAINTADNMLNKNRRGPSINVPPGPAYNWG
jgi:phage-related protein